MSSNEPVLRVVHAQVQFEVAQLSGEVAQATLIANREQRQSDELRQSCNAVAHELRSVMGRPRINPALLDAVRRLYQGECQKRQAAQVRLYAAQLREQKARDALARLRNQQRSLERALQADRRKEQMKHQAFEISRADDMWQQHAWRSEP